MTSKLKNNISDQDSSSFVSQVTAIEGTDLTLIEHNLSLPPEERLLNHQRALDTLNELIKARKLIYGESDPSSEKTP